MSQPVIRSRGSVIRSVPATGIAGVYAAKVTYRFGACAAASQHFFLAFGFSLGSEFHGWRFALYILSGGYVLELRHHCQIITMADETKPVDNPVDNHVDVEAQKETPEKGILIDHEVSPQN